MGRVITIALAGNPNSGKTTVFNSLTGARQHVGNYPGVTVETKEGACRHDGRDIRVVDLPGTYSLTAHSVEELVARNFIIDQKPDVVVDIIDAANVERNLYLAVQFLELGVPLVLAFNMSDVAEARGMKFDLSLLSRLLGAPIVPTVGHKGIGRGELLDAIVRVADAAADWAAPEVHYGPEIETEIGQIRRLLETQGPPPDRLGTRWLAVKLLENDGEVRSKLGSPEILSAVEHSARHLRRVCGDNPEILIADRRYGLISGACQEAVRSSVEARHSLSDKIDVVLTNRVLGLPVFALMMYLVFQLTFAIGNPCTDLLDVLVNEKLAGQVSQLWSRGSDSLLRSLIVDGVIGGVGAVLVFVPLIALLFLAIALLEDSGYMARAAFIMDDLMHKIGLHGKSFVPMLIGFGCSVPAILATRTLDSRRDRLTTMLVTPLMSCGARLPIYALIIPAFFSDRVLVNLGVVSIRQHGSITFLIYLIGIVLAICAAKLLRSTLFRGESAPFVMELPPYRMPTLRGLSVHMWERTWMYLRKAGTLIFALATLLWAANTFPAKSTYDRDYDGAMAAARTAYVEGAGGLNVLLGLPPESDLLRRAARAELELLARQKRYWRHQTEHTRAAERYQATMDTLTEGEGGAALAEFLSARDEVAAARGAFKPAVAGGRLDANSHEHAEQEQARDKALAAIEKAHPRAYPAALAYLDRVKAPFDRTARKLAAQRRAEELAHSLSGRIGRAMVPLLRPIGLGDWRISTALIGAFGAKEMFVSQMGIVYALGEDVDEASESLRARLRADFSPLQGFCIMLFCLISVPCLATIAVTARESHSWRWPLLQLVGLTALAYIVTLAVFQAGRLLL